MSSKVLLRCSSLLKPQIVKGLAARTAASYTQKLAELHEDRRLLVSPPESLMKPINVPNKLLCGPGPSNPSPRVEAASALPMVGHLHKEFYLILDEIKEGLKYVFQTKNEWTFAISGPGHAAMETAVTNLLEPGERILVLVNGMWALRGTLVAERAGCDMIRMDKQPGEYFTLEDIEEGLKKYKPKALFLIHAESSAGILQPLEGVGALCKKYDCLSIVDTVASLGGIPFHADDLEVDVVYAGSQKALSCPPGAAPITFSERAKEVVLNRKTKPISYLFDMEQLANYWGCDEGPRRYHHTPPINTLYALREGLAIIAEEGLEHRWHRHITNAQLFWDGIEELGMKCFVQDKRVRLPTVTTITVPEGVKWDAVMNHMMDTYRLEILGGMGPTAGKVLRVGFLGNNSTKENVDFVLRAFKETLKTLRGY